MKYIAVSQGIKITEFDDKETAYEYARKANESFMKYYQKCIDIGELPADNYVEIYEEPSYNELENEFGIYLNG